MNFYFDQKRNMLAYQCEAPENLLALLPEGKQINGHFVLPYSLRNLQILRWANMPVPEIMDGYDWPSGNPAIKNPYASQKLTANFMVLHPHCFNLGDMGTGKTMAVLWAADWLMQKEPGLKALIVCPVSIMQRVWADAIFLNFMQRRSCKILHGSAEKRAKELAADADFYIVNYEGVSIGAHTRGRFDLDGFSRQISERTDIRLVIIDEASAYKDGTTKRNRIARKLFAHRDYLWLLTGTPTPNAPTDAFGLAKLCNNAQGKSFTTFRNETMYQPVPGGFKWLPQSDGYDKARKLLTPSIRIDIRDVWDGPEMTVQQREVPLTEEQEKHMKELKRSMRVLLTSKQITAVNEAGARNKFLQVSLGAIYDANHVEHLIDAKPRLDELKAVIREASGKLLIFAGLTSVVNFLYDNLSEWTREVVNGNTSEKARARIFHDFQSGVEPRILIADPGTMAHGLNLFAAQTVVWYGATDKPELYAQANARAYRPGQKFPVTVVQLVSNKLEREIFRRLDNKLSLQGTLLDVVRQGL